METHLEPERCGGPALLGMDVHIAVVRQLHHAHVRLDPVHDHLEVIVDAAESRLLVRQRTAPKDRLEVHPLPLDRVEQVQESVQADQPLLPDLGLVREVLEVLAANLL